MLKRFIVLSLIICGFCLCTACKKTVERPDLDLNEISVIDNNDDNQLKQYVLPSNMELVINSEKFLLIKLVDSYNQEGFRDIIFNTEAGCAYGKFIYSKYTGFSGDANSKKPIYKMGYMNRDFTYLTEAVFTKVYPFEDGVAVVKTENGFGVLNIDGSFLIQCEYANMPEFSVNQIRISEGEDEDEDGKYVKHLYFDKKTGEYLYSISQSFNKTDNKVSLVKTDGGNVETNIDAIPEWESGKLIVTIDSESELQGYTDGFGNIVIEPEYDVAYPFANDLARVVKDNKYGYINKEGKVIIKLQYDEAHDFSYGLARVKEDDLYGYIDESGNLVINYQYKKADDFFIDGAAVSKSGLWGYITETGYLAIHYKFPLPSKFAFGYAPVYDFNEMAYIYIDGEGQSILNDLTFYRASEIDSDGYALAHNIIPSDGRSGSAMVQEFYILVIK